MRKQIMTAENKCKQYPENACVEVLFDYSVKNLHLEPATASRLSPALQVTGG